MKNMKNLGRMFVLFWLAGLALSIPARSGAESLGAMRVAIVEGDVQVRIADTGEWVPASVNMPLVEGDELWVPHEGRAALQTSNGAHIRLDEGTALQLLRMDLDSFQLHLAQGHAYVLSLSPARSVLQLDTPDASVRAFGSATFRVDAADRETEIAVFKGSVLAESDAGTTNVRAGEMLALWARGYAERSPLPPLDHWDRWNARQDRIVLARGESHLRLPAELRVYAGDFDGNGRWVYVRDYGYCWTPTVVVIDDWAPYRHGRWVWRGGHYVWIGYEPWGWAPYHYGRWAFVRTVGWCWVPPARGEVFWGPGYVGWVQTPEHVAWVPLAPRETYYGYGRYGRYSVDIANRHETRVTNVYRNAKVANSVTVVHHTTFVTGRPAPVDRRVVRNIREDFAQRRNVVPGRPRIEPVEASRVPVVRAVPAPSRPPAAVRTIDAKKLRQSRPLVREPDRSTLRPEGRSRPLEVRKVEQPRPANERIRERNPEQGRPAPPRDPHDRSGGPPHGRERELERDRTPDTLERKTGPDAPAVPERRNERERPRETTVERRPSADPQAGRDPMEESVRPKSPPSGEAARPEASRERAPERNAERAAERRVGTPQTPSPEKQRPGDSRAAPGRAVDRGTGPEPEAAVRQAPPANDGGAETRRKDSDENDGRRRAVTQRKGGAKPDAGDSGRGENDGRPERATGREEREGTR